MRYRQVHLDFHTSEEIPDIGKDYSKENFQEALRKGHVDSITLFSKCHHGWAYHPSEANEMHPNLKFDLLGAQMEAAHEIRVRTPVYLSAGLDEKMAGRHPEWLIRNRDESTTWARDFSQPGYHRMCFNSPYLEYLLRQIEEVCERYDADGIFLDIVGVAPCYCQNCMRRLRAEGRDPYDEAEVYGLAERVYAEYAERVRERIDRVKPGLPVFHNSGHLRRGRRDLAFYNTHLELESLPTGGWGYDHFPLSAAYGRTLGMEMVGMTGKFHRSWGEFGGFKHPNALRYEAALAAASGAGCSVGDQLHPCGRMDPVTYELIGAAYGELEEKEPWLAGAVNVADVAIFSQEAAENYRQSRKFGTGQTGGVGTGDAGCTRILLEGKYLFDAIDADAAFGGYKVIILPDNIELDGRLRDKFQKYLDEGGKVMLSGTSGVMAAPDPEEEQDSNCGQAVSKESYFGQTKLEKRDFGKTVSERTDFDQTESEQADFGQAVSEKADFSGRASKKPYFGLDLGIRYLGESEFSPAYICPDFEPEPFGRTSFLINGRVQRIENLAGKRVAGLENPYFNRTVRHFSSHAHAPGNRQDAGPGIVLHERGAYIAWDVFRDYGENGSLICKRIVCHVLDELLGEGRTVRTSLPAQGIVTLTRQEGRLVLHLLYASPVRRGQGVEVIEDIIPLYNIKVELRTEKRVRGIWLEPQHEEVSFVQEGDAVRFTVPRLENHQMAVLETD